MDHPRQISHDVPEPRSGPGDSRLSDLALALAATGAALLILFVSREVGARQPDALGIALVVLAGASLLQCRRWPIAVLLFVVAITSVVLALDFPGGTELPLVMAALFATMAQGRRAAALIVLGLLVAASVSYRVVVDQDDPLLVAVTVSLLILVVLLGEGVWARQQLRSEVRERLRVMAAEKELEARTRLVSERLRIAHELHDVLAHTITAITVQATAAADGRELDDPSRAALRSMRATALEAMQQLQATIEVLRSDHDDRPTVAAPDLSDLPELVRGVEETGLEVDVEIDGCPQMLPTAVGLTAYRIVQEALTNVIRHADAQRATVTIRYQAELITLSVVDDGVGARTGADSNGYGIVGMRERAQALGGDLVTGTAQAGGFRVEASLPVGKEAP